MKHRWAPEHPESHDVSSLRLTTIAQRSLPRAYRPHREKESRRARGRPNPATGHRDTHEYGDAVVHAPLFDVNASARSNPRP